MDEPDRRHSRACSGALGSSIQCIGMAISLPLPGSQCLSSFRLCILATSLLCEASEARLEEGSDWRRIQRDRPWVYAEDQVVRLTLVTFFAFSFYPRYSHGHPLTQPTAHPSKHSQAHDAKFHRKGYGFVSGGWGQVRRSRASNDGKWIATTAWF